MAADGRIIVSWDAQQIANCLTTTITTTPTSSANSRTTTVVDVDECILGMGRCSDPDEVCLNTGGGHECRRILCPTGFVKTPKLDSQMPPPRYRKWCSCNLLQDTDVEHFVRSLYYRSALYDVISLSVCLAAYAALSPSLSVTFFLSATLSISVCLSVTLSQSLILCLSVCMHVYVIMFKCI